jgi:DUF1680 family protein
MMIGNSHFEALTGNAMLLPASNGRLYQELSKTPPKTISIKLIPYYAWANRGPSDMSVWLDLVR